MNEDLLKPITLTLTKILQLVGHNESKARTLAKQLHGQVLMVAISYIVASLPKEISHDLIMRASQGQDIDSIMETAAKHARPEKIEESFQNAMEDVLSTYFEEIDSSLQPNQKKAIATFIKTTQVVLKDKND